MIGTVGGFVNLTGSYFSSICSNVSTVYFYSALLNLGKMAVGYTDLFTFVSEGLGFKIELRSVVLDAWTMKFDF